ncbi:MAG TPA: hypothetical protein VK424_03585 [Thermoplasmata archaeon]|nr:hypothetical protein [Thermoplasmata archaeon]
MAAQVNPTAQAVVQSLSGHSMLLMKMQILSLGKNYDVMDEQKQVLCRVGLDAGQNIKGAVVGSAVSQLAGGYVGRFAQRSLRYTYIVRDAQDNPALEIRKSSGGNKAEFQIADPQTNVILGKIDMKRSLIGGLKASWVAPDGRVYMHSKGNIIRRKYEIIGPDGKSVGRVRHKILAIRDVWQLELNPQINHLYSALFATVLDFEKKM